MTLPQLVCIDGRVGQRLPGGDIHMVAAAQLRTPWGRLAPGLSEPLTVEQGVEIVNADPIGWGLIEGGEFPRPAARVQRAMDWAMHGWTAEDLREWVEAGVGGIGKAGKWMEIGASPAEVRRVRSFEGWVFVTAARLPMEHAWGALWRCCTPEFARVGRARAVDPTVIRRLADAMSGPGDRAGGYLLMTDPIEVRLPWTREQSVERTRYAEQNLIGLDWADVTVCLLAGMDPFEAAGYVRDGSDMEPVRLLAALTD